MKVKELGTTIDELYALREKRLDIEKQVKALKQHEYELRNEILLALGEAGLAKASGQIATCGITKSIVPVVTDWEQVHNYIKINDRFDLLQKRISVLAWRGLNESGELVPGTESIEDVDVSLTKSVRGV